MTTEVKVTLLSIKEQTELASQFGPLTLEETIQKSRIIEQFREWREKNKQFHCLGSDPLIAEQQVLLRRLAKKDNTPQPTPKNGQEKGSLRLH